MTRDQRLATTFVELADSLVDDFDVVELMVLLTERCVELLEVSEAGLLLSDGTGRLRLVAATSEALQTVELFQAQADEGPCCECFHTGLAVGVADLSVEDVRWPRFAPVAAGAGFRAVHAVPLRLRGQVLGALNLFGREPGMLRPSYATAAQALADVATVALLQNRAIEESHRISEQLQEALNSRITIEQAKGMIAEHASCGMDEAFESLRRHARSRRARLSVVAAALVNGDVRPEEIRAAVRR